MSWPDSKQAPPEYAPGVLSVHQPVRFNLTIIIITISRISSPYLITKVISIGLCFSKTCKFQIIKLRIRLHTGYLYGDCYRFCFHVKLISLCFVLLIFTLKLGPISIFVYMRISTSFYLTSIVYLNK